MNDHAAFYWERVTRLATALPSVHEQLCHGTNSFYVEKKFFARLKEDGQTLVVYNNDRDEWIEKDPDIFFYTAHYENYAILLVDLKTVSKQALEILLVNSWKIRAPKKLLAQLKS